MAAGGPRPQIALQDVGGVTLISSERANELIVVLNALLNAQMNPAQNVGTVTYSPTGFIWDLSQLAARVSALELATGLDSNTNSVTAANSVQAQLNAINNSLTVINNTVTNLSNTVTNLDNSVTNLDNSFTQLNTTVFQITTSLSGATINATCDNAGGIDITLTIPNLP
jgi:hypothetical protein